MRPSVGRKYINAVGTRCPCFLGGRLLSILKSTNKKFPWLPRSASQKELGPGRWNIFGVASCSSPPSCSSSLGLLGINYRKNDNPSSSFLNIPKYGCVLQSGTLKHNRMSKWKRGTWMVYRCWSTAIFVFRRQSGFINRPPLMPSSGTEREAISA